MNQFKSPANTQSARAEDRRATRALVAPTARQLEVLAFLRAYAAEHGMPPTIREIANKLGVSSVFGVVGHLEALHRRGLVHRADGRSRGWRALTKIPDTDEPRVGDLERSTTTG